VTVWLAGRIAQHKIKNAAAKTKMMRRDERMYGLPN
jgi:hypothetical protein